MSPSGGDNVRVACFPAPLGTLILLLAASSPVIITAVLLIDIDALFSILRLTVLDNDQGIRPPSNDPDPVSVRSPQMWYFGLSAMTILKSEPHRHDAW